jgi:RNA polymerase sigma-70 factor (ECF subfamily)
MTEPSPQTAQLHGWLQRLEAGDLAAREELLRGFGDRLEELAHKMLGRIPRVRRWVDTGDVLQNALLRLLRALEEVRPDSTREFFALAAALIRRELLDLVRYYCGPRGEATNRGGEIHGENSEGPIDPPADGSDDLEELDRWTDFHRAVEELPAEEREVVGLIFYHGWAKADVAQLLQVSDKTIRRRWEAALVKLHGALRNND